VQPLPIGGAGSCAAARWSAPSYDHAAPGGTPDPAQRTHLTRNFARGSPPAAQRSATHRTTSEAGARRRHSSRARLLTGAVLSAAHGNQHASDHHGLDRGVAGAHTVGGRQLPGGGVWRTHRPGGDRTALPARPVAADAHALLHLSAAAHHPCANPTSHCSWCCPTLPVDARSHTEVFGRTSTCAVTHTSNAHRLPGANPALRADSSIGRGC
jgi:hypothetical protein